MVMKQVPIYPFSLARRLSEGSFRNPHWVGPRNTAEVGNMLDDALEESLQPDDPYKN